MNKVIANTTFSACPSKAALLGFIFLSLIISCTTPPEQPLKAEEPPAKDSLTTSKPITKGITDNTDSVDFSYQTYFVLITDTAADYYALQQQMYALQQSLALPVDTMGRYYDAAKNLICLPEDDADEVYVGDYLPRRFPGENLSIEYLLPYVPNSGEQIMCLLAGIYESEIEAGKALQRLQKIAPNAFIYKTEMYVDCVH